MICEKHGVHSTFCRYCDLETIDKHEDKLKMKAHKLAETMEYALKYQQEQGRRIMELERTVPLASAKLRLLVEVNAELLEALDFYGRYILKRAKDGQCMILTPIDHDCGDRARAAIAKAKE